MAKKPTPLDGLIEQAGDLVRKLEPLDHNRKLTFPAFLDEAISLADTTREKVEKLNTDLETKPATKHSHQFVSKLVRVFRESNFPRCPRNHAKVLNAYGSLEAFQELTGLGATVAEAIAVAVIRLHKKFGNDAFGDIKNWDRYERECTDLRGKLHGIYEQMRGAVSGLDLDMSQEGLFQGEVARGLCKVSFKRSPAIGPHHGDWPRELVAAVSAAPKKLIRIRITKAA